MLFDVTRSRGRYLCLHRITTSHISFFAYPLTFSFHRKWMFPGGCITTARQNWWERGMFDPTERKGWRSNSGPQWHNTTDKPTFIFLPSRSPFSLDFDYFSHLRFPPVDSNFRYCLLPFLSDHPPLFLLRKANQSLGAKERKCMHLHQLSSRLPLVIFSFFSHLLHSLPPYLGGLASSCIFLKRKCRQRRNPKAILKDVSVMWLHKSQVTLSS